MKERNELKFFWDSLKRYIAKLKFIEKKKEPWQITAARYCVENSEKGFTKNDLVEYIQSIYSISGRHLEQFWGEEICFPTGRKFSREHDTGKWIPPLDLVSKVSDYEELKEARKNAKYAFIFSMVAIIISLITLWVTFRVGVNQIDVSREQISIQNEAMWNEEMRNDRLETRDNHWRKEDLEFQGRLP